MLRRAAGALLLTAGLSSPGRAFLLPATKAVELWQEATPRADDLRMEGAATLYAPFLPGGRIEGPVRLLVARPDRVRLDLPVPGGTRSVAAVGDRIEILRASPSVPLPPGWIEILLRELLLPPSSDEFVAFLRTLGVRVERTGYGRFLDRVIIILGAKEWETDPPQLWLEQESRLPLHLAYQDRALGQPVEVDLLEYHLKMGGWFPELIKVAVGRKPVLEIRARDEDFNVALPPGSFGGERRSPAERSKGARP